MKPLAEILQDMAPEDAYHYACLINHYKGDVTEQVIDQLYRRHREIKTNDIEWQNMMKGKRT